MKATVKQIYDYASRNNLPLFGNTTQFDFMAAYRADSADFDFSFYRRFSSFFYFPDFDGGSIENVYNDFVRTIRAFFALNNKRFSELYRVQILSDSAYDIVNNYDVTETLQRSTTESNSDTVGSHTDSKTTSESDIYGSRTDTSEAVNGQQTTTSESKISAFNSSAYQDDNKQTVNAGAKTDSGTATKGQQTDSHSGTDSTTFGSHTDTHSGTGSESSTLRRFGNIGVQTPADVIGGHLKLWEMFNFYEMLYNEIGKSFLLVDDSADFGSAGGTFSDSDINAIIAKLNVIEGKIDAIDFDDSEILSAISSATTSINNNTDAKASGLFSDIAGAVSSINGNVNTKASAISEDITTAKNAIIANDNANAASISADILEVETNGY